MHVCDGVCVCVCELAAPAHTSLMQAVVYGSLLRSSSVGCASAPSSSKISSRHCSQHTNAHTHTHTHTHTHGCWLSRQGQSGRRGPMLWMWLQQSTAQGTVLARLPWPPGKSKGERNDPFKGESAGREGRKSRGMKQRWPCGCLQTPLIATLPPLAQKMPTYRDSKRPEDKHVDQKV